MVACTCSKRGSQLTSQRNVDVTDELPAQPRKLGLEGHSIASERDVPLWQTILTSDTFVAGIAALIDEVFRKMSASDRAAMADRESYWSVIVEEMRYGQL